MIWNFKLQTGRPELQPKQNLPKNTQETKLSKNCDPPLEKKT